jgi:hypothetical protein
VNLKEIVCEITEWIYLPQNGKQWRAVVRTVMNFQATQTAGNILAARLLYPEEGPCCMDRFTVFSVGHFEVLSVPRIHSIEW